MSDAKDNAIKKIEAGVNAADELKQRAGERIEKLWRGVKVPRRNAREELRKWVVGLTPVMRDVARESFAAGRKVGK